MIWIIKSMGLMSNFKFQFIEEIFMNNNLRSVFDEKVNSGHQQTTVEPPRYLLIILNDDFTEADFVTSLLMTEFQKDSIEAEFITWRIHTLGCGVAGSFTQDIAMSKADKVHQFAQSKGFPLRCKIYLQE
jgi:ATP-dependent Clp protease adaptor protein ClpS